MGAAGLLSLVRRYSGLLWAKDVRVQKGIPFGTRALMSRNANQAWCDKLEWRDVSSIRTLTASLGVCCVLMFVRDADPRGKRQSIDGQIRSIYRVAEYTAG